MKATLAPVNVIELKLDRDANTAFITVPDSELSLAIGKEGQNVRLASKLTGYNIEVEGIEAPLEPELEEKA